MPRGGFVPDWQRAVIALSATVVVTTIVLALYFGRSVFMPIALAIFLSFVLSPVVARLHRLGVGRTTGVILTVGTALVLAAGTGVVIAQQVVNLSETLTATDDQGRNRRQEFRDRLEALKARVTGSGESRIGQLIDDITGIVVPKPAAGEKPTPVVIASDSPQWLGQVEVYVGPAAELAGQAAFAFILTVFMLLKKEDLRNRMIRLTGHGKVTTTTKAVDDASKRISRYLLMQLLVNTAFGLVITAGLFLMGVPLSPLWGLIATIMRYVPYVGTWIGLIPPVVFSFATADWPAQPLAVLGLFLGLEAFSNNVVEPKLYGQSMGLSEVAQLVAAGFWAFLWGPIGLVLSGPLTVCLLVLGKYVSRYRFLEVLLGDEPVLEPKVAFYQRLAARDQDEASEVARKAAAGGSDPAGVYDKVIVPALCLAKRDEAEGDLSADDLKFAVRAAREVAEEVAAEAPAGGAAETPVDARVRVLLCPARDEIDHVGVDLLANLLDPARWEVEVAADETLASELAARVGTFRPAAVVIGALPPGGMAHTRYLVTRVRSRHPEVKVVVGRWGRGDDFPDDKDEAGGGGADAVETTLAETVKRLNGWYAVFTAAADDKPPAGEKTGGKPRAVGTPAALV